MLILGTQPLAADEGQIRFARFGVEQGLPDSHVHAMQQDEDGFLWFSTRDGLARFDGYHFSVYRHDPFDPTTIHGNWVQKIHQDAQGDFWVPLGVGGIDVFRRDQEIFERVADRLIGPTGAGDIGSASLLSQRGELWFATLSNGVFRWDGNLQQLLPVAERGSSLPVEQQLANSHIQALHEDTRGRLWIGTCAGLDVFDPSQPEAPLQRFATVSGGPEVENLQAGSAGCVVNIYQDVNGSLWIGTSGLGLLQLRDDDAGGWIGRWLSGPRANANLPIGQLIRQIQGTTDGTVWIATSDRGLAAFHPDGRGFRAYPATGDGPSGPGSNNINRLYIDRQDRLWIGTFDAGIDLYDRDRERFLHFRHDAKDPHSLSGNAVSSIFQDRTGNLWVGTFGEGANVYSPSRWKFKHYSPADGNAEGPSGKVITSLAEDADGSLWIGSFDGGLDRFDPKTEIFEAVPLGQPSRRPGVTNLLMDDGNQLWIGTSSGVVLRLDQMEPPQFSVLDPLAAIPNHGRDSITALAQGPGRLWIGTGAHGLHRYDPATGERRSYELDSGGLDQRVPVWAILEDHLGQVWIGTPSFGLYRFDPEAETFEVFRGATRNPGDLDNRTIKSLFQDDSQRLWIGTFSGGLNLFDRGQGKFAPWTVNQGLPSNKIEAILQDASGRLWLSTNRGLASFLPNQGPPRVYDVEDGLQHNEFQQGSALRSRSGDLYFGGRNGINRFRPENIVDNPHPPPILITAFRLFGETQRFERPTHEVEEIVLQHHENVFAFEFAALDFANPSKNRYRYRLEGFDQDWVDAGTERTATYTNLDPGRYVFRVTGSNNDGLRNDAGATVRLRIVPPFWLRWWFFVLEALAAVGLLALALRAQRRRLERRQAAALEQREHLRKTRELDSARLVQLSMLPESDLSTHRFEAAGRMSTASEVGGDYFDFFDLGDGGFCLAVGDAIGHGSAAGLLVGMVKASLHQALEDTPHKEPAELLRDLNKTLCAAVGDRRSGMGLTLLRLRDEPLQAGVSSSAMPYPYLFRAADQRLTSLELGGFPLGLGSLIEPRQKAIELESGDLFVLVTDGLAERQNPVGDVWGYEALEETLQELCGQPLTAAEMASRLLQLNDRWAAGVEPTDDLTVVVVKVKDKDQDKG